MRGTDGAVVRGDTSPSETTAMDDRAGPGRCVGDSTDAPLVSEFTIAHDDLVLTPTVRAMPSARIDPDVPTVGRPDAEYLFFNAVGENLDGFERAIAADATVEEATVISRTDTHHVYRVVAARGAMTVASILPATPIRVLGLRSESDGWWLRVQLPNREVLADVRRTCLDRDVDFRMHKLLNPEGPDLDSAAGLCDHHRETLLTAFEDGYYDVPRGISQEELAEKLDLSTSAISQRLRRSVARLVEETIAVD